MKKVILTEDQIKRMMDKLILNEQGTETNQLSNQNENPIDNNSKYELYKIGNAEIAVERNGGNIKMFSAEIHRGGYNPPRYLSKEMANNPTFTLTQFGQEFGFDVVHNLNIFGGTYTPSEKSDRVKQVPVYGYETLPNGVKIKHERGKREVPVPKEEIQDVTDPKTKENLDEARIATNGGLGRHRQEIIQFNEVEPMQWERIPNSITPGIPCFVIGQNGGQSNVPILGTIFIMETRKRDLPKNEQLEFIDFKENAQLTYGKTAIRNGNTYYWLKFFGSWIGNGSGLSFTPGDNGDKIPKDIPKTNPIVLTFEKGLNDAFNFNDVTLNPTGNQNLEALINYAKQNYQGVNANVPVICSSSIDGDPNQKIKGGVTRAQYDMDLSKRRAEAIANTLTTQIGITTLKFIPQGIGETDQYDPGKKWPTVTNNTETAGNRKLIIQLPKLQKTIQQQK
jgi:outer membrane protein OmpA-like peptidoglycan-associated protein